jgi:TRAP-type uncharacterized transport system substrate-binding protein
MKTRRSRASPSLVRKTSYSLVDEVRAWAELVKAEWKWFLILLAGIAILIAFTSPLPPKDVYLAVGEEGSSFEMLGQKFVPYFAEERVRLNLVRTSGSGASLAELADKDDKVNAALLVGGITQKGSYPNLSSLGSIEYVPLWLFYRGPEIHDGEALTYFANKRVSIGAEGSGTEIMLRKILALRGIALQNKENYLKISHQEALQKLLDGGIDAMCIMDSINAPIVQRLLEHSEIHTATFAYAPAYAKKLPFLDTVIIPKGALDLKALRPAQDVQMLASTTTLLVDREMHPAIQQLFLLAADKIGSEQDQFFAKPEFFPAYVDHAIPLSPVAKRFYEHGAPALKSVLPLWLGSYLDRMWLLLVGAIAVIYPLFKLFPSCRRMLSVMLITDAYEEIRQIEKRLAQANTAAELQSLIDELNELDAATRESVISSDEMNRLYAMKSALNLVRQKTLNYKKELETESVAAVG